MTYEKKAHGSPKPKPFGPRDRLLLILACVLLAVVIVLLLWCIRRDRQGKGPDSGTVS